LLADSAFIPISQMSQVWKWPRADPSNRWKGQLAKEGPRRGGGQQVWGCAWEDRPKAGDRGREREQGEHCCGGCYQPRTDRADLLQVSAGKLEAACSTLWLAQSQ